MVKRDDIFTVSRGASSLNMSFSSTLENIDQADEETKRFLCSAGLEAEAFGIRLAMREGLINAVVHGSRGDRHKIVKYGLRLENNHLIVEIEDQGGGFDWQFHMGKEPALTSESGRGLAIMRSYCTDVAYNGKGNKLVLRKKIGEELLASKIAKQRDQAIVKPGTDVVASMAQGFRNELRSLVEEGLKELVIDLAGVEMIDSIRMSPKTSMAFLRPCSWIRVLPWSALRAED